LQIIKQFSPSGLSVMLPVAVTSPHQKSRVQKNKRMVLFMAYENRIQFYEDQIEALLFNIEEKEKSYIYEQVRIIRQKIEELKSR
jgi:regulatory protein YycI of two-component signal transduction system YycFG